MDAMIDRLWGLAPLALTVIAILLGGLLATHLLARLLVWAVHRLGLDELVERVGLTPALYAVGLRQGIAPLVSKVTWTAGLLVTLLAAADVVGIDGLAAGLGGVVAFLPRLLVAALILALGMRLAELLRTVVRRGRSGPDGLDAPQVAAQAVYYTVVVVTVAFAAEQLGLETTLVNGLILIAGGTLGVGFALAFASGARTAFAHVVARHYVAQALVPGDRVAVVIDGQRREVQILRYGPTSALVRTDDDGEWQIPCALLMEQPIERLALVPLEEGADDDE